MYQFTREFIINDNVGKLNGKRFLAENSDVLKVDHMINIKKDDVCKAYKAEGHADAKEKISIDLSGVTFEAGNVYRLALVLGQEGRVISTFNDQYPEHSRTFIYEAKAKTGGNVAEDFAAAIVKEAAMFESPFFTVATDEDSDSDSAESTLVLEALDCYTRFNEVRVVKVPTDDTSLVGNVLTGYLDYDVLVKADRKEILDGSVAGVSLVTEGDTGKNTTNYIVNNMRLLTAANINPYGTNVDERPLPKSVYDQYTVELVTERRNIGHQVMGAVDKSLVTVIFFVLSGDTSTAFASALEAAGITVE